uniref:DNA2/NAM7 helicase helicase domain-containing protein n=1 Tax=Neogobius melanostomus TaxID=47308 RepID=A0A8C6UN33_9GOBI
MGRLHLWSGLMQILTVSSWLFLLTRTYLAQIELVPSQTTVKACTSKEQIEHEVEITLVLKPGDALQVQMTCEVHRGYWSPVIQLVSITPRFELCVDHVNNPVTCFSRCAESPTCIHYNNIEDYVRIWKPLCEMESASTAIRDSDIIIIENLEVNFNRGNEDTLTGNFFLNSSWIEDWAIKCNLSKCLLCIRKPGVPLKKDLLKKYDLFDNTNPGDPVEFTWVAHGATTKFDVEKKPPSGNLVHFYVNHRPMEHIPDCIFQKGASFTVELIPKTRPDMHVVIRKSFPKKLPPLNRSQFEAVDKALNNTFTLIQGPPGTGKTVVGVYIVLCFVEMNKESPRKLNANSKDKDKKQVILYCGPSNKSVDVVAEYMLRFEDSLKALRVYGEQVEMLDYPFPECVLQFSSKTKAEAAKESLRNITLHHRIRQPTNPDSAEIKAFDQRIKEAIEAEQWIKAAVEAKKTLTAEEPTNPDSTKVTLFDQRIKAAIEARKTFTAEEVKQ